MNLLNTNVNLDLSGNGLPINVVGETVSFNIVVRSGASDNAPNNGFIDDFSLSLSNNDRVIIDVSNHGSFEYQIQAGDNIRIFNTSALQGFRPTLNGNVVGNASSANNGTLFNSPLTGDVDDIPFILNNFTFQTNGVFPITGATFNGVGGESLTFIETPTSGTGQFPDALAGVPEPTTYLVLLFGLLGLGLRLREKA